MRRNEIDAGSQPVRNLLTNPAFESIGTRNLTVRTNHFTNPANVTASGTPLTLRTNLITNPSMEASGGNIAVRTNLVTNPGADASTATTSVRTNLVTSPRGVSAMNPYNATGTLTPNVTITGHPEGFTTAMRVAYTTQSNPGVSLLDLAEAGTVYSMSIWVYHESIMSTPGLQAFAQAGVQSSTGTVLETGKWVKLSWTHTASGTSSIGFRVSSNSGTGNGSYLVTGMIIEKSSVPLPFFDGATTTLNKITNPSFETDINGWTSRWFGNGGGAGTSLRSAGTGIGGGASYRKTWTTANTSNAVDVGISTTVGTYAGQVLTASIYQKSSVTTALTIFVIWKDAADTTLSQSTTTNSVYSPAGAWVRHSQTYTAPAGATKATIVFGPHANATPMPQGATIDWDWALVEESDKLNPYYDGTAAAPADFTYVWNGTANNSTSIQRAPRADNYSVNTTSAKAWQTATISHTGTKSVACESTGTATSNGINFSFSNLPVGTYVFSAYVYLQSAFGTSGIAATSFGSGASVVRGNSVTAIGSWLRSSVKFTVSTLGTTYLYLITDGTSSAPVGSRFFADSFMLEAVPDLSLYFDAANPRTNLTFNPSFDLSTAGWGGAGMSPATISQVTSTAYTGTGSLQVVCDGTYASQGAYTVARATVKPNRYYTASAWVKADAGKTMRLELGEWDGGANIIGSRTNGTNVVGTGGWVRVSATRLLGPNADTVDMVIRNANAVAHTFFLDAVLLEEGDVVNDYYASTGPFTYAWTGTANASTSEQRAPSVAGAVWQGSIPAYQSSERAYIGTNSLYVEGNPSDTAYQVYAGPNVSGLTVGNNYTLSAWVYVMPGSVGLELQPSGVGSIPSGRTVTSGTWERVYQTFVAASSTHTLRLRTTGNGKVQAFIDAMCLEQGVSTNLPYFDGSLVIPTNLVPNPSAETNTTGWASILNASITRSTAEAYVGTASFVVTGTGSGSVEFGTPTGTAGIAVQPNKPYTFSHYGKKAGTTRLNNMYIRWYTSAGVLISESNNTTTATYQQANWARFVFTATAPSTAAFASVAVRISPAQPAGELNYFDAFRFEQSAIANPYSDSPPDLNYLWTGADHASTSIVRGYPVAGQISSKSGVNLDARFWGYQSRDETGKLIAKWVSPAGTPSSGWRVASSSALDYANIQSGKSYTLYIKYRVSGWPTASTTAVVQFSDGGAGSQVMPPDTPNRLNLQVAGWQTYRRTFTATMNANSSTVLYMSLPATPDTATDGVLEVSEMMLLDNSYSGAYFDGSTVSTDPDFSYAWNGTADLSTSKMLGTVITGINNTITHGHAMSSTEWKSSGTTSLRLLAKNVASNDSFTDIRPMVADGGVLKPYTKYTIAGTRYLKAPLTGTLNTATPGFRVFAGTERGITYKQGTVNTAGANRVVGTFVTGDTGATGFIRLQHGGMEGSGDVWWDDVILVEGDYDGRYVDGTKANAKWEGTAHASTSVGYPSTLESLYGMPLLTLTTAGTVALDSSKLGASDARTFYSVVEAPVDLPSGNVDVIWIYGKTGFSDAAGSENTTITYRYQSENGNFNSGLARRTGGAGAFKTGIPVPGRYIMCAGLDTQGKLFSGHAGSPILAPDGLVMAVPHEAMQIYANNTYHTHIVTYLFAGQHDLATRTEVYKLLAQRHNVPLLV